MNRLEEIQARWVAATPGPWALQVDHEAHRFTVVAVRDGQPIVEARRWGLHGATVAVRTADGMVPVHDTTGQADITAIGHAAADIEWLLARAHRLHAIEQALAPLLRWRPAGMLGKRLDALRQLVHGQDRADAHCARCAMSSPTMPPPADRSEHDWTRFAHEQEIALATLLTWAVEIAHRIGVERPRGLGSIGGELAVALDEHVQDVVGEARR